MSKPNIDRRRKRRAKLAREIQQGSSIYEVAARYGASPSSVYAACHEHHVSVRQKPRWYRIVAKLDSPGWTQARIAESEGVSRQYVHKVSCKLKEAREEIERQIPYPPPPSSD